MQIVPVENTAFFDRFVRIRYTILGLTIGLILSYIAIISMDLFGRDYAADYAAHRDKWADSTAWCSTTCTAQILHNGFCTAYFV